MQLPTFRVLYSLISVRKFWQTMTYDKIMPANLHSVSLSLQAIAKRLKAFTVTAVSASRNKIFHTIEMDA